MADLFFSKDVQNLFYGKQVYFLGDSSKSIVVGQQVIVVLRGFVVNEVFALQIYELCTRILYASCSIIVF